jgi:nucleoid DNA-binding protein
MALPMMTATEMVGELADRTGWTRGDVKHLLAELEDIVHLNLGDCIRTKIAGVVIEPKLKPKSKARMGRNPATGEEVKIKAKPASVRVVGRITKPLKDHAPTTRKLQNAL